MDLVCIIIALLITGTAAEDEECKETLAGLEYRGTVSHTNRGLTCQRWDVQTPHRHDRDKMLTGSASDHSNYCRNPDIEMMPWCYTTNPNVRWQYCEIPRCHSNYKECLESFQGYEYRGTLSKTREGFNCQRWDTNSPHIVDSSLELPLPLSNHSNYCRNPNKIHSPWCYTTNSSVIKDFCDLTFCNPAKECKETTTGTDYRGTLSVTKDGLQCQRWDSQVPHKQSYWKYFVDPKSHNNYCRNIGYEKLPWCYTTNAEFRWQYCDIPFCGLSEVICSFDDETCDWSIKNNSNLIWQRINDVNGGQYMKLKILPGFVSGSGNVQILRTPSFKPSTRARCVTINHYTRGAGLSLSFSHGETLQDLDENLSWKMDKVIIPMSLTIYKILISAKFTTNISTTNHEIKIQKIEVKDHQCSECFRCLTGYLCIPLSKFCDLNPDCPDNSDEVNCGVECSIADTYVGYRKRTENGLQCRNKETCSFNGKSRPWCHTQSTKAWEYCSVPKCDTGGLTCDFENDLCDWKLWETRNKWVHQYSTEIGRMVLVLECRPTICNIKNGSIEAIVYSKIQPSANDVGCVTFMYSMDGNGARLSVYMSSDTILGDDDKVFDRHDINTGGLKEGSIFTPLKTPYMVFFKGVLTVNQARRIRISTITYSSGVCKVQHYCDKGQYQCNDGSCIDVHKFCDFNNDCTDKSDEHNCYLDCYSSGTYRGTTNTTVSGLACQRWDDQSPHAHTFTHLGSEENYCRSPDGKSEPWCFTMTSDIRNETCGILPCSNYGDCNPVWDLRGTSYSGHKTKTNSGHTCQRWDKQTPHKHRFPDQEENYCRNPDNSSATWCYTTDPNTRYGYCSIPVCRLQQCRQDPKSHANNVLNTCKYRTPRQDDITNTTLSLFHCFDSIKTIPKEEVCDGFPQCPRNDDEFPCSYGCPNGCTCESRMYKCQSPSNIPLDARVIDLSMNSINIDEFTAYPYLVHLNLSGCSLSKLPEDAFFGIRLQAVNLQLLDLSNNSIYHISKTLFARLKNVLHLNISGNNISVLTLSAFANTNNLRELHFKNSNINLVHCEDSFINYGLKFLDLSYNRIRMITSKALHNFISLTRINLSHNRLSNVDFYFSQNMKHLIELDLSFNNIQNISDLTFSELAILKILHIRNNKIEQLVSYAFSSCLSLEKLDLGNNKIKYIEKKAFINLKALTHLNLTNNILSTLPISRFIYLISLVTLDLSNNQISVLEDNAFSGLDELKYLHMNKNYLSVRKHMFEGMCKLEWLWTDSYTLCCARPLTVEISKCIAPKDKISSCEQLIDVGILGVLIWLMAIFSVVGNIFVLYYRLRSKHINVSQGCFIVNLSVSDLMMGLYLWIIAIADLRYRNVYGYHDAEWRYSSLCTLAGVLATVSSETSVMFVFLITLERCFALKYPFSKKVTRKVARILSVMAWVFSCFISTLPLLLYEDFYIRSTVCISLPLTSEKWNGWEYSTFVFIGVNFGLFLAIIIGQVLIFKEVRHIGRNVNNDTSKRELAVFKSLSYVVLSDTLCWIPVGIVGMMALSGVEIPTNIYAWMIVLVLPVNSALNPYIYTYSAIIKKKESQKLESSSTVMQHSPIRKMKICQ